MAEPKFSVILASRQRVQLLAGLLESIRQTSTPGSVEVLVGLDEDDYPSLEFAQKYKGSLATFHLSPRQKNLNDGYLNTLAGLAFGKYLIACNDDVVFETYGWDRLAEAKLESYLIDKPDRVTYAWLNDALIDRHNMGYCCFPLITREAYRALGFLMPPEFTAWGADVELWRMFALVKRICPIPEVMLHHISYHSGTRDRDDVSRHVERISSFPSGVAGMHYGKLLMAIARGRRNPV